MDEYGGIATSIVETEYGYLFSSISASMVLSSIDFEGNTIENKFYPLDTAISKFNNNNLNYLNDSLLLHVATTTSYDSTQSASLFLWINQFGDTLSTTKNISYFYNEEPLNQWDNPSAYLTRRIITDIEDNIYESAEIRHNSHQLRKFDPSGNMIWEYIFDGTNQHGYVNMYIMDFHEGNLLIPVRILNYGDDFDDDRTYLYTFSLDGQLEQTVLIEDLAFRPQDFAFEGSDLIIASSKNVGGTAPYLLKVSLEGEVLWELPFTDDAYGSHQKFKVVETLGNGEFIAAGDTYETDTESEETDGLYDRPCLMVKFDGNGNVIWERRFMGIQSQGDFHQLIDLKPTSDGGFVFCGESRDGWSNSDTYEAPGQRAWVVKTDEFGCVIPGCQYVGVEEHPEAEEHFVAGPNPVSHSLNIFVGAKTPRGAEFIITDNRGAIVERFISTYGSTNYWVDSSGWASGAYQISLVNQGSVLQSMKVVKG